ncbi:MAG: hypothetical protein ACYC6Y_01845 [Thermoguttaceae bacterium]
MRVTLAVFLVSLVFVSPARAERITIQLEWGFSPPSTQILWDGEVQVSDGTIEKMESFSFEKDKRDRLTPPTFQSFTQNEFSDGMTVVVQGDDRSWVRLKSLQGDFEWSVGQLRERKELSFTGKDRGRLVARLVERLGDEAVGLSEGRTQDSDPALCVLADGRQVVAWRAFLGLPAPGETLESMPPGTVGDQICLRVLDREGKPGPMIAVLGEPGDVETISLAAIGEGLCRLVWSQQVGGNWDLYTCTFNAAGSPPACSAVERLTDQPGVDRHPVLAVTPDGSLVLAWQSWNEGHATISLRRGRGAQWDEPTVLGGAEGNHWLPAMAVSKTGSLAVAWFRWQNGSYDVELRLWDGGRWGPVMTVAATDRHEAMPTLAYDNGGTLWIAYEEGSAGWGMDSHTAGLRPDRNVRLCCCRDGRLVQPAADAALSLPAELLDRSEMAQLACDGQGSLWLFFRRLRGPGVWEILGTWLDDAGWQAPMLIEQTAGGQDVSMAWGVEASGRLRVAWATDQRVSQVGLDNRVFTSRMPVRSVRTAPIETVSLEPAGPAAVGGVKAGDGAVAHAKAADAARATFSFGGAQMGLYFGDLHRHTEQSVCRTGGDGSLADAYRYAIDAAGLDFLCITDHVQHVKILNDYDFWRNGKTADLNRVAGVHQPFYGYERSQRFPLGHRNIISLNRYVRRVPRTRDNRPISANVSYEGEELIPPPEFWASLVGENVVTIPHTSSNPVMGTDFGYPPAGMEPVVEIYQGCRYTAEYAGAPDPRQDRDGEEYGGKTQLAGFLWNALGKGYRYGFIASSDHSATHNSYTCVWAEDFSNEAIQRAIAKRQCYAATDRIQCRMQMGGHLMGSEFQAAKVPPLEVEVTGTTDIDRIDVVKDNMVVFTRSPSPPSPTVRFEFHDAQATPGVHYYYARVIQKDRNMAWISPIWVDVAEER